MAIGTNYATAPVQSVGQTGRTAAGAATTPAQFASQAADRTLGASTGAGAVQTSGGGTAKTGQDVLKFAEGKEGQKVGSGECFDLADEALKANGMKTASDYGKVTPDGDYKWGKPVELNDSQPGDVLQFRNYKHRTDTKTENPDGSGSTGYQTDERPHHTAVVVGNDGKGNITVLEQNAPEGSPTTKRVLHFGNGTSQDGNTTTKEKTTGTIKAYRPEPK
jgi:hypothetical protein